ncbi:hypothetical protein IM792_15520 [Mucilaginibacter sp. JRF]|uniref:hypothetical protein n=1 Tax=Mucilaginibacter sp. JRF TaxID=2780088 RepID=UPI00187F754E|nr:hypothetical protein [Mucilaginibacter sp. JRF]MBE9585865.1 hypothetical protein [Mucilaginibacter sp. JRF]
MKRLSYLFALFACFLVACNKEKTIQPQQTPVNDDTELSTSALADEPVAPYTVRTIAGKFDESGKVNGPGPQARFYKPHGIFVNGDGSLYIADFFNGAIRKISIYNKVSTVELPPEYSQGGLLPEAVTLDPGGTIHIVSTAYGVRIYNKDRGINIVSRIGNADSNLDMERDSESTMWFVNDNSLCKIVKRVITRNVVNFSDYLDQYETLRGIGVGPKGVKYVSTATKLFKVSADGQITRLYPQQRFIFISGIAVSKDGNTLYIADGNAIKKIDNSGISTITGPYGNDGRDGVGREADVVAANLAISNSGKALFVTDTRNTIRKITLP